MDEDREIQVHPPENDHKNSRVCHLCNKRFSSGKALGGHMRIHFKPNKEKQLRPKKIDQKPKLKRSSFSLPAMKPSCCLCGKDFPSLKSLFGHMRCHPERDWRGIQPPPPMPRNSEFSTLSDDHLQVDSDSVATPIIKKPVLDLSQFLSSGWAVTGKRGRKASDEGSNAHSGSGLELDEAVDDLMALANGAPRDSTNSVTENINRVSYCRAENDKGIGCFEAGYVPIKSLKMKENGLMEVTDTSSMKDDSFIRKKLDVGLKLSICNKITKKKKKRRLRDLEVVGSIVVQQQQSVKTEKYKCTICNKSFPSHQALGGHKSYHNKCYSESSPSAEESASEGFLKAANDQGEHFGSPAKGNGNPTTQAREAEASEENTGGSKMDRSTHRWVFAIEGQSASSQVTSPGEAGSRTGIKAHSFDLNELPFVEEEGFFETAFNKLEHATPSYNSVNSQLNLRL